MAAFAASLAQPGIDPRQWVSVGHVDSDEPYAFDPDLGPLISVTLQPSGEPAQCRVSMQVAGDGEGDYHPFVEGDAVLVAMLGGSIRDCVIIGRLCSKRAPFPSSSIAGQDPTKNVIGFTRRRTPYVQENAGPLMLREALSGAFLNIDEKGVVTIRDGQKAALQLTPDTFGYQSGDAKTLLQLDVTGGRFTLQVQDALLTLSSSSASPEVSAIAVPGQLSITTGSNPAAEHAVSTEAVYGIIAGVFAQLAVQLALVPTPITGTALAALFAPPAFSTATLAPGVSFAQVPLLPPLAAAIQAAFATAGQKPPGVPGQGQLQPGIGCASLLVG